MMNLDSGVPPLDTLTDNKSEVQVVEVEKPGPAPTKLSRKTKHDDTNDSDEPQAKAPRLDITSDFAKAVLRTLHAQGSEPCKLYVLLLYQ
jgi:hypothetical protein